MINYQTVCVHQSHGEWFQSARSEQNKVMDHGWENDFDLMAFSDIFLTTSITSLWHVALLALVLFPISYRHKKIVGFAMFAVFLFTVFGNIYSTLFHRHCVCLGVTQKWMTLNYLLTSLHLALIFEKQDVHFLMTLERMKQTGGFFCVMLKWYIHFCDISQCCWWLKSYIIVNITFKDNPCVSHVTSRVYPTPGKMTPAPHGSRRNK